MRIVYVNKVLMDSTLPAVNFTLFQAYGLAQAGAECTLFVQRREEAFEINPLMEQFALRPLENLHVCFFTKKRYMGIETNQWFYRWFRKQVMTLHNSVGIDAVITRDPGALPYLAGLKRSKVLPVFYQPHNFYVDLKVRPDVNRKNVLKYRMLERRYIPAMSAILCLQNSQADWYRKYYPNHRILVAKPGLIRVRNTGTDHFENRLIGYVGSFQWKKGIHTLLEAFRHLQNEGYRLLLIGGRQSEEIRTTRERIHASGFGRQVELAGWMPFSELEKRLEEVSVGILPLKDVFYNRYLTAPNKLFDYLAMGIPVVAADLPALRDFIEDGSEGLFFKPESPESLAKTIRKLFSHRRRYTQYRNHALQTAQKYLWKKKASDLLDTIWEIVHT